MARLYWADEGGLPPSDRGLSYGDGLFETIRVTKGQAPLLDDHLERMIADAGRLGIPVEYDFLSRVCLQALVRFRAAGPDFVLKLILTRGAGGRGYNPGSNLVPNLLVSRSELPPAPDTAGVVADFSPVTLTVNPLLAGIKSLNRLEQVMASRALGGDLFEVLMCSPDGSVVEGTRTNLFVATDEGWLTPPASTLAVSGVMRKKVLACLQAAGECVKEGAITRERLLEAGGHRGLWLTNSVLGLVPVRKLAGRDLPVDTGLATICRSLTTLE